ncbi:hypothetical protein EQF93_07115 [Helcococcus ovis]|uniref:hypothetical protein n=1 Tax=Helcococcus ovis TaxID=72026 RepID=UPI0011006CA6|nr:hypothetical protein EQF93_07115 [Helcococcus ovis]
MQRLQKDIKLADNKYKDGKKNDETVKSLANKSWRPHSYPNEHTQDEKEHHKSTNNAYPCQSTVCLSH